MRFEIKIIISKVHSMNVEIASFGVIFSEVEKAIFQPTIKSDL